MKYMGSKNRIAKDILPIILDNRKPNQYYVEPFVGGANLIDKVGGLRIGNDLNKYLIAMWQGLQQGRILPKHISKELYSRARVECNNKTNSEFDDCMIGWIGWMGSYNGRFFDGGYSGHCVGATKRDYIKEQIVNTEAQIPNILEVEFQSQDYKSLEIPNNSIIYCDIPYKDTKQYVTSKDFNHTEFWEWVRIKTREGHKVYISEYQAPEDFICIWSKEVTNSMNTKTTYKPTEKLFTLKEGKC